MEQIEVGYVSYTLTAERIAQVGADFDVEGADDAILAALNAQVGPAVVVHRNGKVFADADAADRARDIDWSELLRAIDIDQVLADHPTKR